MDSNAIKILLEKYWEGTTSLEEETQLRIYFNGDQVADEFKSFQPLFQFFQLEKEQELPEDFTERVVDNLPEQKPARVYNLRWGMRIAAAIALIIALAFVIRPYLNEQPETEIVASEAGEITDAEEAYEELKMALALVSNKFSKGTDKAQTGIVSIRKATKVIK